jgi:hypothetical protein
VFSKSYKEIIAKSQKHFSQQKSRTSPSQQQPSFLIRGIGLNRETKSTAVLPPGAKVYALRPRISPTTTAAPQRRFIASKSHAHLLHVGRNMQSNLVRNNHASKSLFNDVDLQEVYYIGLVVHFVEFHSFLRLKLRVFCPFWCMEICCAKEAFSGLETYYSHYYFQMGCTFCLL